ncbi:MAG: YcxB family protein [Oscillospiraceae bacterium]
MDCIFENKTVLNTKEEYVDIQKIIGKSVNFGKRTALSALLLASATVLSIIFLSWQISLFCGLLTIVFPLALILRRKSAVNKAYELQKEKIINCERKYEFFDDAFHITTDYSQTDIKYSTVTKLINSTDYIIFVDSGLMYFMKKSGFIKGNAEDFLKFIESKNINIKTI